jgi:hypothetical protein
MTTMLMMALAEEAKPAVSLLDGSVYLPGTLVPP